MQPAGDAASPAVTLSVESTTPLNGAEQTEVQLGARRMLRLDEDFADLYRRQTELRHHPLRIAPGGGRLLRCPTLFEDMVYTLCTTNIAWSGTKRMVHLLTEKLGQPVPGDDSRRAFPTAAAIAAAGPDFLRQETGLGYRSGYVWQLADDVASGRLNLADFEQPDIPTDELYKAVRRLKGFGDYATATVLMLLGRYDRLAIDSELRSFVTRKYFNGQPPQKEADIRAIYEPWGRWRYLAYWFDVPPEDGM
jgi:3-methyladenine DNA glycosylase/8-oxoguanine DNA glycosylase